MKLQVILYLCLSVSTVTADDYHDAIAGVGDYASNVVSDQYGSPDYHGTEADPHGEKIDAYYESEAPHTADGTADFNLGGSSVNATEETVDLDFDEGETNRALAACGRRGITRYLSQQQQEESFWEESRGDDEPLVRIVAGRVTTATEFPWQVSIQKHGRHICGGSVVGSRYIISAAHCFRTRDRKVYKIFVGKSVKSGGESGEVGPFYIEAAVINGNYGKKNRHDSDIALLKLHRPIPYSNLVSRVCLPSTPNIVVPPGTRCYVSGFGRTQNTGGDGLLKAARISILSLAQCQQMTAKWNGGLLTENMVCAGGMKVDDGTSCKGDSGGPLVCETYPGSNRFVLHGVVSFGKANCGDHFHTPTVYTRMSRFLTWAKANYVRLKNYKPATRMEMTMDDDPEFNDMTNTMDDDPEFSSSRGDSWSQGGFFSNSRNEVRGRSLVDDEKITSQNSHLFVD